MGRLSDIVKEFRARSSDIYYQFTRYPALDEKVIVYNTLPLISKLYGYSNDYSVLEDVVGFTCTIGRGLAEIDRVLQVRYNRKGKDRGIEGTIVFEYKIGKGKQNKPGYLADRLLWQVIRNIIIARSLSYSLNFNSHFWASVGLLIYSYNNITRITWIALLHPPSKCDFYKYHIVLSNNNTISERFIFFNALSGLQFELILSAKHYLEGMEISRINTLIYTIKSRIKKKEQERIKTLRGSRNKELEEKVKRLKREVKQKYSSLRDVIAILEWRKKLNM